jgi:hypothetical protein
VGNSTVSPITCDHALVRDLSQECTMSLGNLEEERWAFDVMAVNGHHVRDAYAQIHARLLGFRAEASGSVRQLGRRAMGG